MARVDEWCTDGAAGNKQGTTGRCNGGLMVPAGDKHGTTGRCNGGLMVLA